MRIITTKIVNELLAVGDIKPAVTIYAPMHTTASPPHISENQIRMKNLINQAIHEVTAQYGEDHPLAVELQEWLDAYYDDLGFWEMQSAGILLCAQPGDAQWFNLPVDTDEYVSVDDTFHLAPVLAMLHENHAYYILSVNQHKPKLFGGDMYQLHISDIELPASAQAALGIDETRKSESHGGAKDPQEEDRMKFFRMIDRAICGKGDLSLPMILAGTESETVEFRNLSKYPHILQGIIAGSHTDTNMAALHRQATEIVAKELIRPTHQAALEEYTRLEGANPSRTARDLKSIESAIEQGRVDKLLAPLGSQTTDTIRDTLASVTKITFLEGDNGKLLNRLALRVWQMSGTIVSLKAHEMPHGAPMVARLRY